MKFKSIIYAFIVVVSSVDIGTAHVADPESAEIKSEVEACSERVDMPIGEANLWESNISPGSEMSVVGESEKGAKLTVEWKASEDGWCYPRFRIPQDCRLHAQNAMIARVKSTGTATVGFVVYFESGERFMASSRVPSDGEWHTVVIPLDTFRSLEDKSDLAIQQIEQVALFSVGVNSGLVTDGATVVVNISDVVFATHPNLVQN